jgi:polyphenol oxidase
MFRLARKGPIEYLEAEDLTMQGFATHAFCTRLGGVSTGPHSSLNVGDLVGDREENILRNLDLVRESFGAPNGKLILMRQVHGDRILLLDNDGPLPASLPECDGLITDRLGVALGVRTADCVPILFADRTRRIIGAAHAGWRGTALGIAARMVETLAGRFSSRREDLNVLIGPAIGPCCYQVDAPVFAAFSAMPGADHFLHPCAEEGRWMCDLVLANRLQIRDAGVPSGNIHDSGLCTSCRQDLFFSHRAGGGSAGRQISLLMLRPEDDPKNA